MRRAPLPHHLTTGSFSVRASDKANVTRTRTQAKDLIIVSRGIRVPVDTQAAGAAALRAYTDLDEASTLTHGSAVRIWNGPLPISVAGDWRIHIARSPGFSFPRRVNVVGHLLNLLPEEVVEYDGVRLTSPARTWLDMAARLTVPELVTLGDSFVCHHGPEFPYPRKALCTTEDLKRTVMAHAGMRGVRTARAALELIRVGADSAPETQMRLALLDAGLPEPELNTVVRGFGGRPVLWPDAAYPDLRIALQYDGAHHGDKEQYLRDIARQDTATAHGWLEVRISRFDLDGDRPAVVRKVRSALRSRGWRP